MKEYEKSEGITAPEALFPELESKTGTINGLEYIDLLTPTVKNPTRKNNADALVKSSIKTSETTHVYLVRVHINQVEPGLAQKTNRKLLIISNSEVADERK